MESANESKSTLVILQLFRENIVNDGSARLLDKYDTLIKRISEKQDPNSTVSNFDVFVGLVFGAVCFVAPWAYGLYKFFG